MTKKELIQALQTIDDDTPVIMFADSVYCQYREVVEVKILRVEANLQQKGDYFKNNKGETEAVYLGTDY